MILQHLITFCRVVETGGFSRAGELVGLSQPAVTRQVAALEADLGTPLLDRTSRQFRLTPAGELVYEHARRFASGVAELREMVADLVDHQRGRVVIGAVTTVGVGVLPPILAEFHRRYPAVRVLVKAGRTADTLERVLKGEIDMAITPTPVSHPRLESIPLCQDPVVLVCSPERRKTMPDPLPLEELSQVEMISFQAPSRFRTFVDSVLEQHGVYPNITMEFDSHEAVRLMVEMGFGVAMVPLSAVQSDLDEGRLVRLNVPGLGEIARTTSLLVKKDTPARQVAAENLQAMILKHFGVECGDQ
ncbi:MAG TPA: LysR family transcriptional regulator [Symbiobacteriaceae bacterium]|nr:LysR family transcriptional regulator [Symbiobacteriaceae bacterium]